MFIHKEDSSCECDAPDDDSDRPHQKLPDETVLLSWTAGLSDWFTLLYYDLIIPDYYLFFFLLDVNLLFELLIILHRFLELFLFIPCRFYFVELTLRRILLRRIVL